MKQNANIRYMQKIELYQAVCLRSTTTLAKNIFKTFNQFLQTKTVYF